MRPTLDLHVKIHNQMVIDFVDSINPKLGGQSKQIEDIIILGIAAVRAMSEGKDMFQKGLSKLPSIDLYGKYQINGVDIAAAFNQGALSPEQLNYIYYGALDIVGKIESDKNCRKVIPRLRDINY